MKQKFDTSKITAYAAMFISLITLVTFIYQTRLMHEQSRLSVMPRLGFNEATSHTDSSLTVQYQIWNKGLGPAIIESVSIIYQGEKIDGHFNNFLSEKFPAITELTSSNSSVYLSKGSTISEDESVTLIKMVVPSANAAAFRAILEPLVENNEIDIELIYSSIYNNRWQVNLQSSDSTPVPLK